MAKFAPWSTSTYPQAWNPSYWKNCKHPTIPMEGEALCRQNWSFVEKKNHLSKFSLNTRRIYHSGIIFFCELLVSLIMTSQSTQKVQEKKQSTTISMFLYVCVCTNFNFNYNIMRPPNQCIQFSSTHIQGGGRAARTKYTRWGLFTFWWSPPLQALVIFLEVWRSCERYPN